MFPCSWLKVCNICLLYLLCMHIKVTLDFGIDSVLPMNKNVVSILCFNSIELFSFPIIKMYSAIYYIVFTKYLTVIEILILFILHSSNLLSCVVVKYFDIPKMYLLLNVVKTILSFYIMKTKFKDHSLWLHYHNVRNYYLTKCISIFANRISIGDRKAKEGKTTRTVTNRKSTQWTPEAS